MEVKYICWTIAITAVLALGSDGKGYQVENQQQLEVQINKYYDIFRYYDQDQNHLVSPKEMYTVLQQYSPEPPLYQQVINLFHSHDIDQKDVQRLLTTSRVNVNMPIENGSLDFQEFVDMVEHLQNKGNQETDRVREGFNAYDKDRDGYITVRELVEYAKISVAMAKDVVNDADTDGDGRMSFQEFVAVASQ